MFRRAPSSLISRPLLLSQRSTTLAAAASACSSAPLLSSSLRFNSASSDSSKESELEREARARQEVLNKLGGPGAAAQAAAQGVQQGDGAGSTARMNMQSFNNANHRTGRFFATCVITIAMYIMFKRIGLFGDYSQLAIPYFAASPTDSAKWILFMFNIDENRRRQLHSQWQMQKGQMPAGYNFFDFVDQQEQYWRSSPNNSADSVAALLGNQVATQGAPRAIANVKGTLGGSSPLGMMMSGNLTSPEERAKRIDNMVSGQAMLNTGFGGLLSGGGSAAGAPSLPASLVAQPPQQQQFGAWPQQQQPPPAWGYSPQQQPYGGGFSAAAAGAPPVQPQQSQHMPYYGGQQPQQQWGAPMSQQQLQQIPISGGGGVSAGESSSPSAGEAAAAAPASSTSKAPEVHGTNPFDESKK